MTARKPAAGRPQMQLGFLTSDVLRLLRADFVSRTGDMPLTPRCTACSSTSTVIPAAGRLNSPSGSTSRP